MGAHDTLILTDVNSLDFDRQKSKDGIFDRVMHFFLLVFFFVANLALEQCGTASSGKIFDV